MSRHTPTMKKHSWIILVFVIIGLLIGGLEAKAQPHAYIVNASLIVRAVPNFEYGTSQFGKAGNGTQVDASQTGLSSSGTGQTARADAVILAINDMAELLTRSFMEYVYQSDPGLKAHHITVEELMLDITVTTPVPTSSTIILTVTGTTPSNAVLMANDVINGFVAYKNKRDQTQLELVRTYLQNTYAQDQAENARIEKQIIAYNNPNDPHISLLTSDRNELLKEMDSTQAQLAQLPPSVADGVFVLQPARLAIVVPSYKPLLYFSLIAAAGLLVGLLLWLLLIFLDYRVQVDDQIPEQLGLSYLGTLTKNKEIAIGSIPTTGLAAQQLADIGVNLRLTGILPKQRQTSQGAVLLVTSAEPQEGKTTVATGLAASAAHAGNTVLVIDGNLREAGTHLAFGQTTSSPGLSDVLKANSNQGLDAAVQRSSIPNIWLLPAGSEMEDPTYLLEQRMPAILTQLRKKADWIIIDGPSLLSNADAGLLASMADGAALVANRDRVAVLQRAKAVLKSIKHVPFGVIMNRISTRKHNAYYAVACEEQQAETPQEEALIA